MKTIAVMLLTLTVLFLMGSASVAAEADWYMDGNGTLIGYVGQETVLTVPDKIDGQTVTAIGDSAFRSMTMLEEVTLPDSVTSIGNHAFFMCETLKHVHIPDRVQTIGEGAFGKCYALETLTLPASLESFDPLSLHFCSALTAVSLSEKNEAFMVQDGVLFSKDGTVLLYYPPAKADTAYTVPDGVTTIAVGAFEECNLLETIVLPESLKTVVSGAFLRCESLTAVMFNGDETAWGDVMIGEDNEPIAGAAVEFDSGMSTGTLVAIGAGPIAAWLAVAVVLKRNKEKQG